MHLRVTQAWFDTVQHDAEVQMARLVKQQDAAARTLGAKNAQLLEMARARHASDVANEGRLHEGHLRRARVLATSDRDARPARRRRRWRGRACAHPTQ